MATKKKTTKKKITKKKVAGARKPAKKKVTKKKAPARPAGKAAGTTRRRGTPSPSKKRSTGSSTRSARVDAERREAAVREQLSKAKIGTFEDLVEPCDPETRTTAEQPRSLVLELIPDARETVYLRWRIAIYKRATEICGIQPAGDRCNFYLTKGAYLQDPQGILEGSGKTIRHVKVRSVVGMAAEALRDLLKQALEITVS